MNLLDSLTKNVEYGVSYVSVKYNLGAFREYFLRGYFDWPETAFPLQTVQCMSIGIDMTERTNLFENSYASRHTNCWHLLNFIRAYAFIVISGEEF